jgi:hypothetical protein
LDDSFKHNHKVYKSYNGIDARFIQDDLIPIGKNKMEYRIKKDGFKEIQRRLITQQISITLFVISITIFIYFSNINSLKTENVFLPIVLILVPIFLVLSFKRTIKTHKNAFESYKINIDEHNIIRENQLLGSKTIPKNQILSISKQKNGDLTIMGDNHLGFINIPAQIENYTEIEQILNQIQPIMNIEKENLWVKYASYFNYLIFILFIGVFFLKNKIIVALSGSILIVFLMGSFIYVMKSKLIDKKTKKLFWGVFILILGIMGAMYTKLV